VSYYPDGTDTRARSVEVEITCEVCSNDFGTPGFEELGSAFAHDPDAECPYCSGDEEDSFDLHAEATALSAYLNERRRLRDAN